MSPRIKFIKAPAEYSFAKSGPSFTRFTKDTTAPVDDVDVKLYSEPTKLSNQHGIGKKNIFHYIMIFLFEMREMQKLATRRQNSKTKKKQKKNSRQSLKNKNSKKKNEGTIGHNLFGIVWRIWSQIQQSSSRLSAHLNTWADQLMELGFMGSWVDGVFLDGNLLQKRYTPTLGWLYRWVWMIFCWWNVSPIFWKFYSKAQILNY